MRKAKSYTKNGTGLAVIDDTHLNSEQFYKDLWKHRRWGEVGPAMPLGFLLDMILDYACLFHLYFVHVMINLCFECVSFMLLFMLSWSAMPLGSYLFETVTINVFSRQHLRPTLLMPPFWPDALQMLPLGISSCSISSISGQQFNVSIIFFSWGTISSSCAITAWMNFLSVSSCAWNFRRQRWWSNAWLQISFFKKNNEQANQCAKPNGWHKLAQDWLSSMTHI